MAECRGVALGPLERVCLVLLLSFFFTGPASTKIYTLSLHDALPISGDHDLLAPGHAVQLVAHPRHRSEEHTSELQSQSNLVCRLLLEKKKITRSAARSC